MEVDVATVAREDSATHPADSIFILENPAEPAAPGETHQQDTSASRPTCAFAAKPCSRLALPGYPLCAKHILKDKSAPFKRCTFLHPQTHRRCSTGVPSDSPDPALCRIHKKKVLRDGNPVVSEFVAPSPRAPRDQELSSAVKRRKALNLEAEKKRENLLREQALIKIIDSYGPLGKTAVFTTASDLDLGRKRPPADTAAQELSRKEKIRRLLMSTRMNAIRCEIEAEKEFLMTPHQYSQEFESICVEYAKKEVVAPLVIPTEPEAPKVPPASPAEVEKPAKFAAKPLEEGLSLKDMTSVFSASDMTPTKSRKKVKKEGEEVMAKDAEKPKKKSAKKKEATEAPVEVEKVKEVYPTNCTFAGCGERCVPLTHYCYMHILNEPGQLLFQPCEWNEAGISCGYPIPKAQVPALCYLHVELSQKAKKASQPAPSPAPSSSADGDQPGAPTIPSTPSENSGEADSATKKKKAAPRKRKAPTETPVDGAEADAAMKPPKPKKPRKSSKNTPTDKAPLTFVADPTAVSLASSLVPPQPAPTPVDTQPALVPLLIPKSEDTTSNVNIQPMAISAWKSLAGPDPGAPTTDPDDDNPFPPF